MEQTIAARHSLGHLSDHQLREALASANIPTLLLVLAQLTGDRDWLEGRFRPTRTVALDGNDTGGLSELARQEIVTAALEVLRAVRDGQHPMPPSPSDDELVSLLGRSLGENVPTEYGPSMAEEGGFRSARARPAGRRRSP